MAQAPVQLPEVRKQPKPITRGPMHKVECPWCGFMNDFKGDFDAGGSDGLEPGSDCSCDNPKCKRFFRVVGVETITIITLKPIGRPRGR